MCHVIVQTPCIVLERITFIPYFITTLPVGVSEMASLDEGLQALEEVHGALVNIISSDSAEMLRKAVDKQRLIWEHFHQTEKTASQLMSELMQAEERVAQKVLDAEQQKNRGLGELERLEKELWGAASRNNKLGAEVDFLQKELEALKETEKEMQHLQEEIDEDTTVVIPSAVYKAQLYHNVTKIKWDHGAEPHILRGVHYGADIATPINFDTTQQSETFVSNYLWSLVSTEW
ncbi:kinetochore protein Spc24 isoform X1 [Huso huso]|uniref:Kinetochore protein Spc24 n=1 Tax=Huso huso TaxID=61971 RepID=A0ABR0Y871_HUSHU